MTSPTRSSGTLYTQRTKLPWDAGRKFRILSIDGGGIRGIFPAAILAEVERTMTSGRSAGRYFDMIAGTSTGGIIALALAHGLTAQQALSLYVEHGATIFPRRTSDCALLATVQKFHRTVTDFFSYRYSADALDNALRGAFGMKSFGEATARLVIPAFDQNNEVFLFKTPHHPDYKMDWKESVVTVARATSSAPTFFKIFKNGSRRFLDGGVWANNPIMCAVIDALACYEVDRRDIEVLSIGCAENPFVIGPSHVGGGIWAWREILAASSQLQSQNAIGQARLLLGGDLVTRVDFTPPRPIEMDDYVGAVAALPAEAARVVTVERQRLSSFFDQERPKFEAFYGPRSIPSAG